MIYVILNNAFFCPLSPSLSAWKVVKWAREVRHELLPFSAGAGVASYCGQLRSALSIGIWIDG